MHEFLSSQINHQLTRMTGLKLSHSTTEAKKQTIRLKKDQDHRVDSSMHLSIHLTIVNSRSTLSSSCFQRLACITCLHLGPEKQMYAMHIVDDHVEYV